MNPSDQADKLRAFEEIDCKRGDNDEGPDAISFWPQAVFYSIGFILTVGWTSSDLWTGNCGTAVARQSSICSLFGLVAFSAFLWAGFSRHHWSAAVRFLISGSMPVLFPFIILLVRGVD